MAASTLAQAVSTEVADPASGSFFSEAEAQFQALVSWAERADSATLSEIERGVEHRGRQVLRAVVQGHLDLRAVKEEKAKAVEGADEVKRTHRRSGEARGLTTLFGNVSASRIRYESRQKAPSLCPLDGALNLPAGVYSHRVAEILAWSSTQGSFDNAIKTLEQMSGITVPKRQAEELIQRAAASFETFYTQRSVEAIRDTLTDSTLTVLTTDGKGILVYPEDLREETRKKLEKQRGPGLYFRKRMAQVASVYHVAPHHRSTEAIVGALVGKPIRVAEPKPNRPQPQDKRVWASIVDDCDEVVEQMFEEALRRDPEQRTTWLAVVDGAGHQIEVLRDTARAHGVHLVIVCDIIHVLSYLWDAAKALLPNDDAQRRSWVEKRLRRLLRGEVSQVAAGIRRAKTMRRRKLNKEQRETLDACADYLLNHKHQLRYDEYLAAGFPISSGVIEGTVRHLVNDRMAITGAHWRLLSAEAVLRLRALRCSGDFDEYWAYHERCELERNHLQKYKDAELPPETTGGGHRPKLRIIR